MKKTLILLMLLPVVGLSFTGNDLWPKCKVLENYLNGTTLYSVKKGFDAGFCEGVIDSAIEAVMAAGWQYSPNAMNCYVNSPVLKGVIDSQVESAFVKYLRENPQSRNQNVNSLMSTVFRMKFPTPDSCKDLLPKQTVDTSAMDKLLGKPKESFFEKIKKAI